MEKYLLQHVLKFRLKPMSIVEVDLNKLLSKAELQLEL